MSAQGRHRSGRALTLAVAIAIASSGCLAVLNLDEDSIELADGGPGDGGGERDSGRYDASVGDDSGDDDDTDASPDGPATDGAPVSTDDPCTSAGWHRDCTFGDGGFATLAPALVSTAVSASDRAGNVYILGSVPPLSLQAATLVTILADGGVAPDASVLPNVAPVLDVRVLDDGELGLLATFRSDGLALAVVVDAGVAVESVSANSKLIVSDPFTGFASETPVRLLTVSGTSWTAAGELLPNMNVPPLVFGPLLLDFDMAAQTSSVAATGPTGFASAAAVSVDAGTWFVAAPGTGQAFTEAASGTGAFTSGVCSADGGSMPFGDIAAVADSPVGVAPTPSGFSARLLTREGVCPVVAAYADAIHGEPQELWTTRGAVAGLDSLVVVGHEIDDAEDQLLVAHLPISGAAADASTPFTLSVADGVATSIHLGPSATLGRPTLAGPYLYVPFVASLPGADLGAPLFLSVVRLVYGAP